MSIYDLAMQYLFGASGSAGHNPDKVDGMALFSAIGQALDLSAASSGNIFPDLATLSAALTYPTNTSAWVVGDAIAANNGVYMKVGGSGAGSWARKADLPYSVINATDGGAGTANAIQATATLPVAESALIRIIASKTSTASPVTISFNGESALTIKTNGGNDPSVGGIRQGMVLLGMSIGTTFRRVSDEASAAIQAAAEAARDLAQAAAAAAAASAAAAQTGIADHSVAPVKRALGAWTTVASAATVDLGGRTSRNIVITGTTAITSFGSTAVTDGIPFLVRFAAALTLTNGASLILPGAANITTAADDVATIVADSVGVWRVVDYQRNAAILIAGVAANNVVQLDASAKLPAVDGSNLLNLPSIVRAWADFYWNGTAVVIRGSSGISSIVRNALGDYTVTFSAALPSAFYAVEGSLSGNYGVAAAVHASTIGAAATLKTATQCRIIYAEYGVNTYDPIGAGGGTIMFIVG